MKGIGRPLARSLLPATPAVVLSALGLAVLAGPDGAAWVGWLLLALAAGCAGLAARLTGPLADAVSDAVFGHRDPDAEDVNGMPGGGGHGGSGGQVPPHVPYSRDHDPRRRDH